MASAVVVVVIGPVVDVDPAMSEIEAKEPVGRERERALVADRDERGRVGDGGDLADLSIRARRILDQNGLTEVAILASGNLDEYRINPQRLKRLIANSR